MSNEKTETDPKDIEFYKNALANNNIHYKKVQMELDAEKEFSRSLQSVIEQYSNTHFDQGVLLEQEESFEKKRERIAIKIMTADVINGKLDDSEIHAMKAAKRAVRFAEALLVELKA